MLNKFNDDKNIQKVVEYVMDSRIGLLNAEEVKKDMPNITKKTGLSEKEVVDAVASLLGPEFYGYYKKA